MLFNVKEKMLSTHRSLVKCRHSGVRAGEQKINKTGRPFFLPFFLTDHKFAGK